jgi:hypothetical protein
LKVDFQGARVTSDGGLTLVRELHERLGLSGHVRRGTHESVTGVTGDWQIRLSNGKVGFIPSSAAE